MSGGTFDYVQCRVSEAIENIEEVLRKNNVTVQENWDRADEDARECMAEWERPWDRLKHPWWVDEEAEKKADERFGFEWVERPGHIGKYREYKGKTVDKLTKKQLDEWNALRWEEIQKLIDDHNNSPVGYFYSEGTVKLIREMLPTIKKAAIYLQRIDWLFAGDDGEDNFRERVDEDLKEAGLDEDKNS